MSFLGLGAGASTVVGTATAVVAGTALAVTAAVGVVESQQSAGEQPVDTSQPVSYGN